MRIYLVACLVTMAMNIATCEIHPPSEMSVPSDFNNQEGCYIRELNRMIPFDRIDSPEDGETCIQYECRSDATISILTCDDDVAIPKGCTKFSNLTLPYPACCPRALC